MRRFTYYVSGNRIDRIEVEDLVGGTTLYRKINFTYHEDVSGAVESGTGDLVGIEDEKLLSPSSTWLKRRWVFKYFTGTYNSSTNPGYPYQVKAVLGPQSVRDFEAANPSLDIYTRTASQLSSYVDRTYAYFSDKRIRDLDLKSSCGCGGGEGLYTYTWDVNGTPPMDFVTWDRRANITLPSANGSKRIIDYNKYGQTLNWIAQEVAGDTGSRRWIRTLIRDTTARLTESFSPKACTSYNDSTHVVTTNSTAGQRFQFAYDGNSALTTVKLRKPSNGDLNFQQKKAFSLVTSSDRRRFLKTSDKDYPLETTTDTGGVETSFSYTYHASDALAVKIRTTTMPVVATGENGSGSAITLKDWFETNGLNTWTKDGDGFVHYTGFDMSRRTVTKRVVNLNTSSPPSGVPSSPDATFNTSSGLNLITDMEYDWLRRMTKHVSPSFTDDANTTVSTTKRWWYTKLSTGELVTIEYPHVDTSYYHGALSLTLRDFEGHVLTSALGELSAGYRDTTLSDDFDPSQSTLDAGFHGTIVRRTVSAYTGDKLSQQDAWIVASGPDQASNKYTTTHTFDASGRHLTTQNAVGTITRWSYDVLGRKKSAKVGTIDGGAQDNMLLVEELFYDDEEDTSTNVGDGNLTRVKRYTDTGVSRITDTAYDYRQRVTQVDEPGSVRETREYIKCETTTNTNLSEPSFVYRYDVSSGSVLMAKTQHYFDSWRRVYETRTAGVSGGSESGYASVRTWRNGHGSVIKTLSQGKVLNKTQYDGAGRVTNRAVSYDTAETSYGDADDLTGDTVIQETRFVLDNTGSPSLVGSYERRHDGSGTGGLTVGSSGNGRAQYLATWHDKLHRPTFSVNYGTNAGTDLTSRPSGAPPSSSSSTSLVTKMTYTVKGEVRQTTDPLAKIVQTEYDDPGRLVKKIENYVDGTPGVPSDYDRTTEITYNGINLVKRMIAKLAGYHAGTATYYDLITENVYGVVRNTDNSKVTSNDLLWKIKYADPDGSPPTVGLPSEDANDQETFAYNAQGEVIWRKDQNTTEHFVDLDDRGRLIHDRVTVLGSGVDTASNRRVSRTYDALDRPINVTSYDNATVGSGSVLNDMQYEYSRYNTVSKFYQEWVGAVATGSSRKVQYSYSFPTDGTTAVRRTSTTYTDGTTVIDDIYNSGTDDTISRLSGQKKSGSWLFQDSYLGLGRLVKRVYGTTPVEWTLVGTDSANNDNYVGLDRFGRIDKLVVKNTSSGVIHNNYVYTYNYNSQVTLRETQPSQLYEYYFDESFGYDGLGRLIDHKRGDWTGSTWSPLNLHECWTCDRSGNVIYYYNAPTTDCSNGTPVTFNASNELPSGTFNDAGDLLSHNPGTQWDFTHSAWNDQLRVKSASITVSLYKYNGDDRKIERINATPALYYYRGADDRILEDINKTTGAVHHNYVGGTQYIDDIVLRDAASPEFMVVDANNNVITRLNSSGAVLARYVYDGYGNPYQVTANWATFDSITDDWYLFTGRQYHKAHAQYDYRNRTQDSALYSFIQRDPIGLWGDGINFGNGYAYAGNEPVSQRDPYGLHIPSSGIIHFDCPFSAEKATITIVNEDGSRTEITRCICKYKCPDCPALYNKISDATCDRRENQTESWTLNPPDPCTAERCKKNWGSKTPCIACRRNVIKRAIDLLIPRLPNPFGPGTCGFVLDQGSSPCGVSLQHAQNPYGGMIAFSNWVRFDPELPGGVENAVDSSAGNSFRIFRSVFSRPSTWE